MNTKLRNSIVLVALMEAAFFANQQLGELLSQGRQNFPFEEGSIVDLQIDAQNRKWVAASGADGFGLWVLDDGGWQAIPLPEMASDEQWQFAIGPSDHVRLATAQGLYELNADEWILHPSAENLLRGELRLSVDKDGSTWLGYHGDERSGLMRFDGDWHQLLEGINITEVAASPDGHVWVGSDNGDMMVFDHGAIAQTFTMDDYNRTNQAFGASSIWDIEFDKQGYVWAASESRIYRFDGETWKIYTTPDDFLGTSDMTVEKNGHIWMAFLNQIAQFDGAHWHWVFDTKGYYASGDVVAKDAQGKIWLADDDQVHSLDPEKVYFPSIDLIRWNRFLSGDSLIFLETSLLLLLVSVWLNSGRSALLTVGFGFFFLVIANYFLFPDHWDLTGKLLDAWPLIRPAFWVLAGGVLGTLISRLLLAQKKIQANDLRFTTLGAGFGIAIGIFQVYQFLAGTPLP